MQARATRSTWVCDLTGDDAAVNRQHRGGPVSPTDPIDCEGPTSPRPMLEEEAEKMMEEKRKARRLSADQ